MNKIILYILVITNINVLSASNVMYLEPINIKVLNSSDNEFSPSWNSFNSTLFFTSTRDKNEKLYTSNKNADGFLQAPNFLDNPINIFHKNISYITFLNEEKAYFSSFLFDGNKPRLQLFYSNYKKKAWSEGFPIEEFNNDKFVGHSSISSDGNQIAFTTQSEEGDLDLMISYRLEDGSWRDPQSIDIMNSRGDEITPHFASDDTLYFASDGQGGPGGFDIYFSIKSEGIWQRPSPLYELNTEYDESDVCVLPNGDLIFASNRPGGQGGLDLWLANSNRVLIDKLNSKPITIDLQSYIRNIVVNNNYEYTNLPVSSILFPEDSTKELLPDFFNFLDNSQLQKIETIEDSYYNTLNLLGHKLQKYKKSNLEIVAIYPSQIEIDTNKTKNAKYYADLNINRILSFFKEQFKIPSTRITYNYEFSQKENHKPLILLKSDNPDLFAEIEIRKDNILLEQKFLPFDVKIEPELNLSNWLAVIELSGQPSIIYENNKVTDRVTVDLTKYKKQLFEADFMNLTIKAFSNNGDSAVKTISHSVEHHFSKKPKLITNENKYFDYHYILSSYDNNIESNLYKASVDKIYNSISMCRSIEIKYNKSYKLASSLKEKLQSKITGNQLKVKLTKSEGNVDDKQLDDNLIIVMIEKFHRQSSNN